MRSLVISASKLDSKDRWTAEQHISRHLALINQIVSARYETVKLGKLARVRGGKRLPPKAQYSANGVPYVRVIDIGEYEIDLNNVVYISPQLHKSIEKYQLEYNDIGIVIVGATIGKVAIFKSHVKPCNFNENLARITVTDTSLNPDYLLAYLQSKFGQAFIRWLTGGSAQAKLSLIKTQQIQIPLPPRGMQDRIAEVMQAAYATYHEMIAEAERLYRGIEVLVLGRLAIDVTRLQRRRAVIKPIGQIAGGRFDFEAVTADLGVNLNGFVPTPLNAVVTQITDRVLPPKECPDEDVNYIGLGHIASNIGELVEFSPVKGVQVLSSSIKFKQGDILFGRMRPYLNKVWIAEFDGICTGEAVVLRPNPQRVDTVFLHALLMSRITLMQVVPFQSGTSLPRVSASHILSTKLPIPQSIEQQKEISDEITRHRVEARHLQAEAERAMAEAKAAAEKMILGEEVA